MKHLLEFRDAGLVKGLAARITHDLEGRNLCLMEVCGTHTTAMFRHGLRALICDRVRLLSGPGCPVCVTPNAYLDRAIGIARQYGVTLTTFGDMIRVPGSHSSLERERARGADVRIVYSPLEAVSMAAADSSLKVVFLGVGFETTAPLVASSILEAEKKGLGNFFVLSSHRRVPPTLEVLAGDPEIAIDGLILPGHVSVILGSSAYEPLTRKYSLPAVVTGFEPLDILSGIYKLVRQHLEGRAEVETAYSRAVTAAGNTKALFILDQVFEVVDAEWRGIGSIPGSGFAIQDSLAHLDAEKVFPVDIEPSRDNPSCLCGEVLRGKISPPGCSLFAETCTPESPVGPCMVSSEGTCAAYYKYATRT